MLVTYISISRPCGNCKECPVVHQLVVCHFRGAKIDVLVETARIYHWECWPCHDEGLCQVPTDVGHHRNVDHDDYYIGE